jgi:hypothetical protein
MNVSDKLEKVSDSFTVNIYDNGFMIDVSGRDSDNEYKSARILCQNLEQVIELVTEITNMERDS